MRDGNKGTKVKGRDVLERPIKDWPALLPLLVHSFECIHVCVHVHMSEHQCGGQPEVNVQSLPVVLPPLH